ncbi:MAG TPA: hypothetical protein VIU16_12460 [Gaiellaceae bacterium]
MIFLPYNAARAVAFDLPQRADATPTFVVYTPQGGTQQASASVTLDAVDTTLGGAAAAGAQTVSVASAAGVTVGRKYLIGGSEDTGGERVTVTGVSGTTVTLARKLRLAHASGAAFQSSRVTCAVSAIATVARHYRIEIAWSVGGTAQPPFERTFDVVRYVPESNVTAFDDVADTDPVSGKRLPAGVWFPATRDAAWDEILDHVAAKVDPGAIVSSTALSRAHRYLIRALLAETGGDEWAAYRDDMRKRFAEVLDGALGAAAIDNDGDGVIEPNEGWMRGIPLARA